MSHKHTHPTIRYNQQVEDALGSGHHQSDVRHPADPHRRPRPRTQHVHAQSSRRRTLQADRHHVDEQLGSAHDDD